MKRHSYLLVLFLLFTFRTAYADELSIRDSIRNQARNALLSENFPELERLSILYGKNDKRTPSGAQKISLFDDGLNLALTPPPNEDEKYCDRMEKKVLNWIGAYPKSPAARIAYARALSAHAFFFRGKGYANTVPEEAWEPFFRYENIAMDYLNKNESIASADTGWYAIKIHIAKHLGWKRERINPFIEEALSKNVDDDRIYYAVLDYLFPKWHGDADQLEHFVSYVVTKTQEKRGMELYARFYAAASQFQYKHELFSQSKASWPRMKIGFEDLLRRYPDPWNANIYAHFACLARDKEKSVELMKMIGGSPALIVWEPDGIEVFTRCRDWALSS
ncbi:MAG: hypothetical protein HY067_12630 [Betaproteobacteria bacterium]|nr:hypothetical protein [Betaproteobacteria bacterium]